MDKFVFNKALDTALMVNIQEVVAAYADDDQNMVVIILKDGREIKIPTGVPTFFLKSLYEEIE